MTLSSAVTQDRLCQNFEITSSVALPKANPSLAHWTWPAKLPMAHSSTASDPSCTRRLFGGTRKYCCWKQLAAVSAGTRKKLIKNLFIALFKL